MKLNPNYQPKYDLLEKFECYPLEKEKLVIKNEEEKKSDENRLNQIMKIIDSDETLTEIEKNSLKPILQQYNDIFYLKDDIFSFAKGVTHKINILENSAPINQKNYRLPQAHKEAINKEVVKMLEDDVIIPSKSPWNSPLLVVPKKAGPNGEKQVRVVIDFRKLNKITIKDAFPLPQIEDILDQLGHSKYFSTLDLAMGYHQVLLDEKDREKTAFSTDIGHFEFKRMPFGLTGAPATFQRMMNYVLTGLQGIQCLVYLDDIVVCGTSIEDHNRKLITVFERLRTANLKLKTTKCHFLKKKITFLGHICGQEGVRPNPKLTEAIQSHPIPKNVKELHLSLE